MRLDTFTRRGLAVLVALLVTLLFFGHVLARHDEPDQEDVPQPPASQIPGVQANEIVLNNRFIEEYMGRATITTTFTVDTVGSIHPIRTDGDVHIAGRAPEVKLPIVAEIMNAGSDEAKEAVALARRLEGASEPVSLVGAWRVWFERGGTPRQEQGAKLDRIELSNPDHYFEIHPVSRIGDQSLLGTFREIAKDNQKYKPRDAHSAFLHYEHLLCKVTPGPTTTRIVSQMAGYNYVDFVLQIEGDQQVVEDGRMVMASVRDLDGELLVRGRRMVFVKDTEPERAVRGLKAGDQLAVLGIPRLDLEKIHWESQNGRNKRPSLDFREGFPYEIIVVAVYKDRKPLAPAGLAPPNFGLHHPFQPARQGVRAGGLVNSLSSTTVSKRPH